MLMLQVSTDWLMAALLPLKKKEMLPQLVCDNHQLSIKHFYNGGAGLRIRIPIDMPTDNTIRSRILFCNVIEDISLSRLCFILCAAVLRHWVSHEQHG